MKQKRSLKVIFQTSFLCKLLARQVGVSLLDYDSADKPGYVVE